MNKPTNKILRIVPFHEIRWLSRVSTVSRIISLLEPLLRFYKQLFENENHPRYINLCTYKTLKFLHIILDILGPLSSITRMSQSNSLDIVAMRNILRQEVENLKKLRDEEGTYERQFENTLEKSENEENEEITYKFFGHELKFRERDMNQIKNAKLAYLDTILKDISERFKGFNKSLMKLSFLFELKNLQDNKIISSVEKLRGVYPDHIDVNSFVAEIRAIKTILHGEKKNFRTFSEMAEWFLTSTNKTHFPHLHFFISLILVLPFCTADCERSFSAMNFLKSSIRNRLKEILKSLMLLYTANKKEIKDIDLDKCAKKVSTQVWSRSKRKWNATEDYMRSIV